MRGRFGFIGWAFFVLWLVFGLWFLLVFAGCNLSLWWFYVQERFRDSRLFGMALALLVVLLCLLPLVGAFMPRFFGVGPGLIALLGLGFWRAGSGGWPVLNKGAFGFAGLVVLLALVSSFWAIDGDFAVERGVKVALVLLPIALLFSLAQNMGAVERRLFARVFPVLVILAGLVCVVDLYANGAFYYFSHEKTRAVINLSWLNRSMIIFALSLLPALYAVRVGGYSARWRAVVYCALGVVAGLVLYQTDSQSVHVAVALAAVFWFLFPVRLRAAWCVLGGLMVAGVLIAPWFVQAMFTHIAAYVREPGSWLAHAYAADRMEIWDFVARKALESPVYGFGIEATRHIEHFDTAKLYTPHDHVLHPHNLVMQIWIEFGVIGAALLCVGLGMALRQMWRLESLVERRFALSVFMASFVVANTAYGVWQGWWLGLLGFMVVSFVLLQVRRESE